MFNIQVTPNQPLQTVSLQGYSHGATLINKSIFSVIYVDTVPVNIQTSLPLNPGASCFWNENTPLYVGIDPNLGVIANLFVAENVSEFVDPSVMAQFTAKELLRIGVTELRAGTITLFTGVVTNAPTDILTTNISTLWVVTDNLLNCFLLDNQNINVIQHFLSSGGYIYIDGAYTFRMEASAIGGSANVTVMKPTEQS